MNYRAYGQFRLIRCPAAGTAEIRRASVTVVAAAVLLVCLGAGCGDSSSAPSGASTAAAKRTASSSSSFDSLVEKWQRGMGLSRDLRLTSHPTTGSTVTPSCSIP